MIEGFFRLAEDIALREGIDPRWLTNGKRADPPILGPLRDELIAEALWCHCGADGVMACLGLRDFEVFAEAAVRGASALGRETQAEAWRKRLRRAQREAERRKEPA